MIDGLFDINEFHEQGFIKTSIRPEMADFFLDLMRKEIYKEDIPDEPDYPGYVEKYYRDRYISRQDKDDQSQRSPWKTLFAASLIEYVRPLLRFYGRGMEPNLTNVSAYEGRKGYMMDWHQDIGDRCIVECLLYLNAIDWQPMHGGEFEMARVVRGDNGQITERFLLGLVPPAHGTLIIMNNNTPHYEHRAKEWNADHTRFSLIGMIGLLGTD